MNVAGTAGIVWQRTRLNGQDCFNNIVTLPAGTPCGPSNPGFLGSTVSDNRSATGFRGSAQLGLSADLRIAVLSIGGFFRYDSHVPGVENPNSQTAANNTSPARVRFDDGIAYGGYVTVRVPLHFGL